jgi:hypothetical protein
MLDEIPIAGLQVAGFVVLSVMSLVATSAACSLLERFHLTGWIWNPPLFFLGLWACIGFGAALFFYGP